MPVPPKSISYRDLRNTPGRVFERLAAGEPLALVSEGAARALLIPIEDGDVATALDAWRRGRALLALGRLQAGARRAGTADLALEEIASEVRAARRSRRRRESDR
jgi:antitoxin (DNA-binding transcriptional repressor) of toxin-antitoxin stability system